jgi:hypothetical protein
MLITYMITVPILQKCHIYVPFRRSHLPVVALSNFLLSPIFWDTHGGSAADADRIKKRITVRPAAPLVGGTSAPSPAGGGGKNGPPRGGGPPRRRPRRRPRRQRARIPPRPDLPSRRRPGPRRMAGRATQRRRHPRCRPRAVPRPRLRP